MPITWQQAEGLRRQSIHRPGRRVAAQRELFDRRRSPNRERSRARRRSLGLSGPLPHHLACHFTEAERAVMRIVGDECRDRGRCAEFIDAIAARAGVSRTTVKNALRVARQLGLVAVTERRITGTRNDSNLVRVISPEWLAWLRHPRAKTAGKILPSTDQQAKKEASRGRKSQVSCRDGP